MKQKLRQDFAEFCRRMRTKRFFKNEPTAQFNEVPAFSPTSSWKNFFKEKLMTDLIETSKFKTKRFNQPKRAQIFYL